MPTELAGHRLLARLGKRVLRPGGRELTARLLAHAALPGAVVVELAPGLGRTARDILAQHPSRYVGVDNEPTAVRTVARIVGDRGRVVLGDASATALPDAFADVVVGEALLTMQGARAKEVIVAEAVRMLRSGGRLAIHELGLTADVSAETATQIRTELARALRVNARPQTLAEWSALLTSQGLVVDFDASAPMALLQPRRIVADEGLFGALRFVKNLITHPDERRRVLTMRRTFRTHRDSLIAIAIVAHKP